jgi:hypothetical protein
VIVLSVIFKPAFELLGVEEVSNNKVKERRGEQRVSRLENISSSFYVQSLP